MYRERVHWGKNELKPLTATQNSLTFVDKRLATKLNFWSRKIILIEIFLKQHQDKISHIIGIDFHIFCCLLS